MYANYVPDFEMNVQGLFMQADIKQKVLSLTVDTRSDQAAMVQVNLDNSDLKLADHPLFQVGKDVEVHMGYADNLKPMILGEIVSVAASFPESGAPSLTMIAYDKSHGMRHNSPARYTFPRMNDSLIAAQIAAENFMIP